MVQAFASTSHDVNPLVVARVDSRYLSTTIDSVDKVGKIQTVGFACEAVPVPTA